MEAQSQKAEDAVDSLFANILANNTDKIDHYQAKIDFIAERVAKQPKLLGYKLYKLHIAQAYLLYMQGLLQQAYEHLELADKLLTGHEMQSTYSRAQDKILAYMRSHVEKQTRNDNLDALKKASVTALVTATVSFAIGGVVTGITYSLANPGSTYLVTSGLFLVGAINLVRAIYYFFKWTAAKAVSR